MASSIEKRESVKKDYDIIADAYCEEFGKKYDDIEVVEEFLKLLDTNSKIIDLGGGTGKLTDLFIKRNHDAICYDFSKEMQRKSKEFFGDLPYILDDMLNIKNHFEKDSIDAVIAFYSLFHVPRENIADLFSDINDILKNNGVLCFCVQQGEEEGFIDEPYLKDDGKNVLYMNFFTSEYIDKLLADNHFEKVFETTKNEVGENELGDSCNKKIFIIAIKKELK